MRRGLMSWSRQEMPVAQLDERLARLQAAMREAGLDALLVYTSFAQPSAVHWITHFTPYWSEALLVVRPEGAPVLLAALTKRVHPWIREVSHLQELRMTPRLGTGAVDLLASTGAAGQAARLGVVGLDDLPWSVAEPLFQAYPGARLVDASALFAAVRQPADAAELGLARQALAKAQAALNGLDSVQAQRASAVTTTIEHSARLAGAEEVLQRLAPDLSHSPALQRMEGDMALGSCWAVEVSLAYKGVWVRCTENRSTGRAPASWADAEKWFAMAAAALSTDPSPTWPTPPGQLVSWTLEACTGAQPLVTVAALHRPATHALPAGSLAVFSVQLELADGPWHFAAPVVLGSAGQASELLHA